MAFKKVDQKPNFPKKEEEILKFWNKNKIFEKSVEKNKTDRSYSFYDGPPFATGLPHYGHLLAGFIKDAIPRFKTMQGYRVERVWGWDTHGLPIENLVEADLGFTNKKQIEEYGIDKFNELCRAKVLSYAEEWKKIVSRTGRWIDMDNAYLTMNPSYMESVWWAFKTLWDKKLIYSGHRVMPFCPRCSTPLSNFEVGLGYADKNDKSVTIKFELEDSPGTYILAWTTTPWTLPANMALAVGEDIDYVKVRDETGLYILAKERMAHFKVKEDDVIEIMKGSVLVGKKYKSLFPYHTEDIKAHVIIGADFVSTEDGTGIVHIAPAFGEDDYRVGRENEIDFFMPVDEFGKFTDEVTEYVGLPVIDPATNQQIIDDLEKRKVVVKVETITHSYPFCYRCDTPLIYRAVSSWFVNIQKRKDELLALNEGIFWMPEFVGKGRFAKIIEGAPDWNISRNRFWGTPLPIWQCEGCKKYHVFGSIEELSKISGKEVTDLHLHKIKDIEIICECGGKATISGEVLDCWFESGSMPYASKHYPFENKERFEHNFPASFIAEGIDQTRGWFNSLLILSGALFDKPAMKSVVVNGIVLAEDGQKMSKRLQNYPDPLEVIQKYGADALRFYLLSSPAVKAEDLRFSEKGVDEVVKKIILTLWHSYTFFVTYANLDGFEPKNEVSLENKLDYWIISQINELTRDVTDALGSYDLSKYTRLMNDFLDDLSNWYIRRSRRRFWKSENDADKKAAYETLYYILVTYTKLLAPYMPFVTEQMYQNLVLSVDKNAAESIHLSQWPAYDEKLIDEKVNSAIHLARNIVEKGLKLRALAGVNVRQPLQSITVFDLRDRKLSKDLLDAAREELNVKEIIFRGKEADGKGEKISINANVNFKVLGPKLGQKIKEVSKALQEKRYKLKGDKYLILGEEYSKEEVSVRLEVEKKGSVVENDGTVAVALNTAITPELKEEGLAREFVRKIQDGRKKADFEVSDRIEIRFDTKSKTLKTMISGKWQKYVMKETLATKISPEKTKDVDYNEEADIEKQQIWIGLKRKK